LDAIAMNEPQGKTDFFISYRGACADWALWINWAIRNAGFSTVLMSEFRVGTTWTGEMRQAVQDCCRLVPLYSEEYWGSGACVEEFDAYWRQHMENGKARFLLPFAVQDCAVPKMHAPLLACRLHKLDRDAAYAAICQVLRGIAPLDSNPSIFVGDEPQYPGATVATGSSVDWPQAVPNWRWPLANHEDARRAYATLVTRGSTYQILAIQGESETGKTHLTRQFFTDGNRRLPGCACGRFDFKGTANLSASLSEFVTHLEVPLPAANVTLTEGFNSVLRNLDIQKRPTILIFDTYEFAGEADRWMREVLLTSLHKKPWLRVVLAGKSVPERVGQIWEEDSVTIRVKTPSAADWHAWGIANKRNVTLSFVEELHEQCQGRSSLLSSVMGPL